MPTACPNDRIADQLDRIVRMARLYDLTRALVVMTADREYAYGQLIQAGLRGQLPVYRYSVSGREQYSPERFRWESCQAAFHEPAEVIRAAGDLQGPALVILEEILPALREQGGEPQARIQFARVLETPGQGKVLVLLGPIGGDHALPGILSAQIDRLSLGLPTRDDLETLAREEVAVAGQKHQRPHDLDQLRIWAPRLGQELVGLTQSAARQALRDALVLDGDDLAGAQAHLTSLRAALLSRELAMSLLETETAPEPIGLEYLREFLEVNRVRIGVPGKDRCKGVLLFGPPGTGKTMLARAMGRLLHLPVVDFRLSSLMNSLLGETEQRFERAFQTLDALAPAIVFMDEMDKLFAAQGGEVDGGTMQRCIGRMLTWLSESEAPLFIVGTGNNPTRMGEVGQTMTRSGRFDGAFFVDVPKKAARREILCQLLADKLDATQVEPEAAYLADQTERFTGADLKACVERAHAQARYRREPLGRAVLMEEVERLRPRTQALYEEFMPLRRWARIHCEPAGPAE